MTVLPSALLHRQPTYLPSTDANEQTARVSAWLLREGYLHASGVLTALLRRHETVTLTELYANPEALTSLRSTAASFSVRLWTGYYSPHGYWRPQAAGYTDNVLEAGVFSFDEAWRVSSHAGSEKMLCYEIVPHGAT